MIKLSPFTLEVKLRYLSATLIIMLQCLLFSGSYYNEINELVLSQNSYFVSNEANDIMIFTIYLVPFILAWAMFNRWYFMISTMIIFEIVLFFTIVLGMIWNQSIIINPEGHTIYFLSIVVDTLIVVSFAMYLKRTIKNRKVTSTK